MRFKPYELHVSGSPKLYLIDRGLAKRVARYNWRYDPQSRRAKATVRCRQPRVMLHKFLTRLVGKRWQEIWFSNGNVYDCRIVNLLPYRREEEGARRRNFKGKKIPYKGVSQKKNGKFVASIRVRGKLKHLGYFESSELAAQAYKEAFQMIHPKI